MFIILDFSDQPTHYGNMVNVNKTAHFLDPSEGEETYTLEFGIEVGPTVINLAFFSRPYGLIRDYIKVI